MTVGELRQVLRDLPDATPVLTEGVDIWGYVDLSAAAPGQAVARKPTSLTGSWRECNAGEKGQTVLFLT